MGIDSEVDDMMARPPRGSTDRVIDTRMWSGVILIGIVMAIATLFTLDSYLPGGFVEGDRDLANARTAGFTTLVLAQLFNCFNARSEDRSAFVDLFGNTWLWGAIALSVVMQVAVVHIDVLNRAFGTAPLTLDQWLTCTAVASAVVWVSEMRKLVARH